MQLVQKQAPINDPNNKRKLGYHIIDELSLFYYRYIFRFSSQRALLSPDVFYDRYVSEDFETQYVPPRVRGGLPPVPHSGEQGGTAPNTRFISIDELYE
ncbi:MAG: hypothetical protein ACOYIK_07775 [Coriobacteriales bacterium]|jgi:hypothetical protein